MHKYALPIFQNLQVCSNRRLDTIFLWPEISFHYRKSRDIPCLFHINLLKIKSMHMFMGISNYRQNCRRVLRHYVNTRTILPTKINSCNTHSCKIMNFYSQGLSSLTNYTAMQGLKPHSPSSVDQWRMEDFVKLTPGERFAASALRKKTNSKLAPSA